MRDWDCYCKENNVCPFEELETCHEKNNVFYSVFRIFCEFVGF